MRNCGECEPNGLELVGDVHLLSTLRSLRADDLIEVELEYVIENQQVIARPPSGRPGSRMTIYVGTGFA